MGKGTTQAIWIVLTIVIGLVVVFSLIALLSGAAKKVKKGTEPAIEAGAGGVTEAIKIAQCQTLCTSCCIAHEASECEGEEYAGVMQKDCTGADCCVNIYTECEC
jgi:hypothetical protein